MGMQPRSRSPWSLFSSCRRPTPFLLSIVTGILVGTSYIPFPAWAIFFCFIPLWIVWLNSKSAGEIFWYGFVAQFTFSLIGFNWVAYTVHEFGHFPWPLAIVTLFLFCAFANLHVPIAGWLWFQTQKHLQFGIGAQISLLVLISALAERNFPMIFDWHFGYTWLWMGFPAFHLADIIGFSGLSTLGYLANGVWLWAFLRYRLQKPYLKWAVSVPILFVGLNLAGYFHGKTWRSTDAKVHALMVQANIGNQEKLLSEVGAAYRNVVVDRFVDLTKKGLSQFPNTGFIIWPETAFPEPIEESRLIFGYATRLKQELQIFGVPLITGAYSFHEKSRKITNSFFMLSAAGEWIDTPYHKSTLLAFGEFIPGAEWFPKLKTWLPEVADFARGDGPTVKKFQLNSGETIFLGAQICYESLFDSFSRNLARKGAEMIVNLTNDSWYGTWEEPYQHGYMTFARAIEVRRPLLRSTNTGITGIMLATGDLLELSPLAKPWAYGYEVRYLKNPPLTLFSRWGYYLIPAVLFCALLGLIVYGIKRSR